MLLASDRRRGAVPPIRPSRSEAASEAVNVATNLYTSGQFFGVLIVMLLGAIMVTNEFFHQTATTTFLVDAAPGGGHPGQVRPPRSCWALLFWLVTTVLNLIFVAADPERARRRHPARRAGGLAGDRAQRAGLRALGGRSASASAC